MALGTDVLSITYASAGEIAFYRAAADVRFALTMTQRAETVRFIKSEGADADCLVLAHALS